MRNDNVDQAIERQNTGSERVENTSREQEMSSIFIKGRIDNNADHNSQRRTQRVYRV